MSASASSDPAAPWPLEIRVFREQKRLEVAFDNGETVDLPAELLRVESPSADVQGHHPSQKKTVPGKKDVGIVDLEPVGNYAVRINFDDGHTTGIYSWTYLLKLSRDRDAIWQRYLDAMAEQGLSR